MFLSFSSYSFQIPWQDEFWPAFVVTRVVTSIHICTTMHTQDPHVYSPLISNTPEYTIHTPHHTHTYTTYTHTSHTHKTFLYMHQTHHTTHTFPLTPSTHPAALTPHKCDLATGYLLTYFPTLSLVFCTSAAPFPLPLLEQAKHTPVFASAVSSAEFLFPRHAHGLLSFTKKALPWPRNQGSTQISVLSAPPHCSPDWP